MSSTESPSPATPHLAIVARLPAKPGMREDLAGALQDALDAVQDEPGCRMYLLHEDLKDADVLWFYEFYEDQAALEAHSSGPALKALPEKIGPFLGGRPELHRLRVRGGKGL